MNKRHSGGPKGRRSPPGTAAQDAAGGRPPLLPHPERLDDPAFREWLRNTARDFLQDNPPASPHGHPPEATEGDPDDRPQSP